MRYLSCFFLAQYQKIFLLKGRVYYGHNEANGMIKKISDLKNYIKTLFFFKTQSYVPDI